MKQRRRIHYSAVQRSEIWDRWQAGESMSSIGRGFDRESSSVFSVISPTGGIRHGMVQRLRSAALSESRSASKVKYLKIEPPGARAAGGTEAFL